MICCFKNVDNVLLRIMIIIIIIMMIKSENNYIFMWKSREFNLFLFTYVLVRGDIENHYRGSSETTYIFDRLMTHKQCLLIIISISADQELMKRSFNRIYIS